MARPLTIWTNVALPTSLRDAWVARLAPHRVVFAPTLGATARDVTPADPELARADIAFGQPDPAQLLRHPHLRWFEVSSAGYGRYDTPEFRESFRARGRFFTNLSSVFADPCAQHALAMMLALGRQLPASWRDQAGDHGWHYAERRYESRLLTGQTVVLLGFGAIGRRLADLLAPFRVKLYAVRRRVYSEPGVHIVDESRLSAVLAEADHVVNVLPENDTTFGYVNARRLSCFKPGARFYNVGRGSTVDQEALREALLSGRVGAAYLDVMTPEPLPPEHPLWTTPNCYLTPHTAGGRSDQDEATLAHFEENLRALLSEGAPRLDRVE